MKILEKLKDAFSKNNTMYEDIEYHKTCERIVNLTTEKNIQNNNNIKVYDNNDLFWITTEFKIIKYSYKNDIQLLFIFTIHKKSKYTKIIGREKTI